MSDQLPQEKNHPARDPLGTLHELDARIARAPSLEEVILLTQVRGELIRQNSSALDQETKRFLQKWRLLSRTCLSVAALGVGALLIFSGYNLPGLFVLGASLYPLAPRFTMGFFKRKSTGEDRE